MATRLLTLLTLLLRFVAAHRKHDAATLDLDALSPEAVLAFLNSLERERRNTAATRNVRLAAILAFFRFVGTQHPEYLEHTQRILAIPFKRAPRRAIEYLEYDEIAALLAGIGRSTPAGRRDYAPAGDDIQHRWPGPGAPRPARPGPSFTPPFHVRLVGKGRKERTCPLWLQTAQVLRAWCGERGPDLPLEAPVFCNQRGQPLTRFGVRFILAKYVKRAKASGGFRKARSSIHIASGTAPPSISSRPGSTWLRSHTGWVTPASTRRTSTRVSTST